MGIETAIVAGVASIAGSAVKASGARKASGYASQAAAAQRELNMLELEREKRSLQQNQQQVNAQRIATAQNQGITNSSLNIQAEQALETQLNTEIEYLDERADLSSEIAYYQTKANEASNKANATGGIISGIGGAIGSIFG